MLSLGDALHWAVRALAHAQIDTPRLDAELLLGHLVGSSRAGIYARWNEQLAAPDTERFTALVRRRQQREPIAYIIGSRPFYDTEIVVDPGVLIPRPETEIIVEEALAWCSPRIGQTLRVADVGTGSGAMAIVLASHLSEAHVIGCDISPSALTTARRNIARHQLQDRVHLVRADLLDGVGGSFDVIVANLPYIPSRRLDSLAPDVRDYEPRLALDGGPDGLDVIRRLLAQVDERLQRPGLLLLEIDQGQGEATARLARRFLPGSDVRVLPDLAGLERIVRVESFLAKEDHDLEIPTDCP